jgi:hypothetical protein
MNLEPSTYILLGPCLATIIVGCLALISKRFLNSVPRWAHHVIWVVLAIGFWVGGFLLWRWHHESPSPDSQESTAYPWNTRPAFEFWLLPLLDGFAAAIALGFLFFIYDNFSDYEGNLIGEQKEEFNACKARGQDKTLWVVVAGVVVAGYYLIGNLFAATGFLIVNWLAWQFRWHWRWKRKR